MVRPQPGAQISPGITCHASCRDGPHHLTSPAAPAGLPRSVMKSRLPVRLEAEGSGRFLRAVVDEGRSLAEVNGFTYDISSMIQA